MASITIVSGCPGTGKTTLAERLSAATSQGMHLVADAFYEAIASPISPILPESQQQNTTVTIATARAAGVFASGGYEVFVDGVVGPWFIPTFAGELVELNVSVEYVVVRAGLDETLRRSAARPQPALENVVRQMHAAFRDLGEFEKHAVDTSGCTLDETLKEVTKRRRRGEFRLELSRYSM